MATTRRELRQQMSFGARLLLGVRVLLACRRKGHAWQKWQRRERNGTHYYTRRCRRCWKRTWVFDNGETLG